MECDRSALLVPQVNYSEKIKSERVREKVDVMDRMDPACGYCLVLYYVSPPSLAPLWVLNLFIGITRQWALRRHKSRMKKTMLILCGWIHWERSLSVLLMRLAADVFCFYNLLANQFWSGINIFVLNSDSF